MTAAITPVRTARGHNVADMSLLCSCTARVEPAHKKLRILLNLSRLIQAPLRKDATGSPCRVHSHAEVADSIVAAPRFHAARQRHPSGQEDPNPLLHRDVRKRGVV